MERLRSVARASGASSTVLVQEAAAALVALGGDPPQLVTACRRLVERHPSVGPMWWLASRVLCAADPAAEAWLVSTELEEDTTAAMVAAALPDDATVLLAGWPELALEGVRRRGDLEVLLLSGGGEAAGLARRLAAAGLVVEEVPDSGVGAAVPAADLVLLEAAAAGPDAFVGVVGSHAAAAVATAAGVPVWVVAGAGRSLPAPLWNALTNRLARSTLPAWDRDDEIVSLRLCDQVIGPSGSKPCSEDLVESPWPVAPELLKPLS